MFSRILVPTDFSEHSDMALEHARALATKFGSTLHLLHVLELSLDSLLVQVASGKRFVPFDSPDAMESFGAPPLVREFEEAA